MNFLAPRRSASPSGSPSAIAASTARSAAVLVALCVLLAGALPFPAAAQGTPSPGADGPTEEEQQELLARAQEIASPGPEHDLLASLAGRWLMAVKIWGPPGQPPMSATGESVQTMILGGRFLRAEASSGDGQQRIESLTLFGYDRRLDLYTMVGFDNLGTYAVNAEGVYDPESKTLDLDGSTLDPISGEVTNYRFELHKLSDDVYTLSLFFETPDGDDVLLMETTYTRAG